MHLYRVDKRTFKVGDEILPQTEFENKLDEESLLVEQVLDEVRPTVLPARNQCLFLFHELVGALMFWTKYGGNIYEVEPNGKIFHMGDMNKIDNILDIARFTDDSELLKVAANEYWKSGTHTFKSCYEILVQKAKVIKCLATDRDLQAFGNDYAAICSIERTNMYKALIQD